MSNFDNLISDDGDLLEFTYFPSSTNLQTDDVSGFDFWNQPISELFNDTPSAVGDNVIALQEEADVYSKTDKLTELFVGSASFADMKVEDSKPPVPTYTEGDLPTMTTANAAADDIQDKVLNSNNNVGLISIKTEDKFSDDTMPTAKPIIQKALLKTNPAERERYERRKERNRIAARKCREKKVTTIKMYEDRVEELHQEVQSLEEDIRELENRRRQLRLVLINYFQQNIAGMHLANAEEPAVENQSSNTNESH